MFNIYYLWTQKLEHEGTLEQTYLPFAGQGVTLQER